MSAPAAASTAISIPETCPVVGRASPAATRVCLLLADIAAVLLARFLGASLWSLVNASIGIDNEFDLWMSLWLFLLVYAAFGLYSASGLGAVEELRRIVLGAALVSLVLTAAAFLSKAGGVYSRAFSSAPAFWWHCSRRSIGQRCDGWSPINRGGAYRF